MYVLPLVLLSLIGFSKQSCLDVYQYNITATISDLCLLRTELDASMRSIERILNLSPPANRNITHKIPTISCTSVAEMYPQVPIMQE